MKICRRKDGKTFKLPRRFTKKRCMKKIKVYYEIFMCSYKYCKKYLIF